jgi:hypothetical protein
MTTEEQQRNSQQSFLERLPEHLRYEISDFFAAQGAWGMHATPGQAGLRLGDLNIGPYAEIREVSDNRSLRARGSLLRPGQSPPSQGYYLVSKADLWSDNSAALYEEAIQRRWVPATDIAWQTVKPLPDDLELAICQICTALCSMSSALGTAVGKHLQDMSYEFHEVKCFLATECFDHARHLDAFRKRALLNGGGLLVPPSFAYKTMLEERDWVGASTEIHIVVESFLRTFLEACEWAAPHPAEKSLFGLVIQDVSRHIAYGMDHIRYMLRVQPQRVDELSNYLLGAEAFILDQYFDRHTWQALAILMGGSIEGYDHGSELVWDVQRKMVRDYVCRLESVGLADYAHPSGRVRGIRYRLKKLLDDVAQSS